MLVPLLLFLAAGHQAEPVQQSYLGDQVPPSTVTSGKPSSLGDRGGTYLGSALSDPSYAFAEAVVSFSDRVVGMNPKAGAAGWLRLVNQAFSLGDLHVGVTTEDLLGLCVEAIPSPESWPIIERSLSGGAIKSPARRRAVLLLMDVLQGKLHSSQDRLRAIEKSPLDPGQGRTLEPLELTLAIRRHDVGAVEAVMARMAAKPMGYLNEDGLYIPDFVPLVGEKRARPLLYKLLAGAKADLVFNRRGYFAFGDSNPTADLARRILIERPERAVWPQWTLACSLHAGDLYDRYLRQFPNAEAKGVRLQDVFGSPSNQAAYYRLVILILNGDLAGAKAFGAAHSASIGVGFAFEDHRILAQLKRKGKLQAYLQCTGDLAMQSPGSNLINSYMATAEEYETLPRLERFLKKYAARDAMNKTDKSRTDWLNYSLANVYQREGKFAEFLALPQPSGGWETVNANVAAEASRMLWLGRKLKRRNLYERGLEIAVKSCEQGSDAVPDEVFRAVIRFGYGPQIERSLTKALAQPVRFEGRQIPGQEDAARLAAFYYRTGRFRDVVTLLERCPRWEETDLGALQFGSGHRSIQFMAADSLAKVGRKRESLRVLEEDLRQRPGDDDELALLLEIAPNQAGIFLDRLAQAWPNDIAPPVWKAKLLLRQGNNDKAEKLVRSAIKADPECMGEIGSRSRFMAYSVLAEIDRRNGRLQDAARHAEFAQSADLAAKADELDRMSLPTEAAPLYRMAVAKAPNDFMIRLSLGFDLVETGRDSEGLNQIRIASQNVPSRWGNLNMFGRLFTSRRKALDMVQDSLRNQTNHGSRNPGVYNSLGSILDAEDDEAGATKFYQVAVKLDPDDLFAWRGLSEITGMPEGDLFDRARSNLVRLGDYQPSYLPNPDILDYRRFWLQVSTKGRGTLRFPEPVFELKASRAYLRKNGDPSFVSDRFNRPWAYGFGPPGETMPSDSLIQAILKYADSVRG